MFCLPYQMEVPDGWTKFQTEGQMKSWAEGQMKWPERRPETKLERGFS
jgi:hypothetical protein